MKTWLNRLRLELAYGIILLSILGRLWHMNRKGNGTANAFTIVELLIVIVVIGILAAITIVAYNGIQNRAKMASVQSDLTNGAKSLELSRVNSSNDQYPVDAIAANLRASTGTVLSYNYLASSNGYCLTAVNSNISYFATNMVPKFQQGSCVGLMGWYPLNGTVRDMSGNGRDGTPSGTVVTTGQNGQANGAYSLNGAVGDYIDTGYTYAADQLTASIWVLADGTGQGGFGTILSNSRDCCSTNRGFQMQYSRTSPYALSSMLWAGSNGVATSSTISPGLTLNTWIHLAITFDGATLITYMNGAQIASASYAGTLGTPLWHLYIGRMGEFGGPYSFGGKVDDVRIFSRALPASEIQALYANGAS
jgi:prepilin-type N-terminal cleavage/methylation domain-containing protein